MLVYTNRDFLDNREHTEQTHTCSQVYYFLKEAKASPENTSLSSDTNISKWTDRKI